MSERQYGIAYTAKTDTARANIQGLKAEILALHAVAESSKGAMGGAFKVNVSGLDKAATTLGTIGATAGSIQKVADAITQMDFSVGVLTKELPPVVTALRAIGDANIRIGNTAAALHGLGTRASIASGDAVKLGTALNGVAGHGAALGAASDHVQGVQRKLYGAKKNAEELGAALAQIPAKAGAINGAVGPIDAVKDAAKGAKVELRGAAAGGVRLGKSLRNMAAGISVLNAARMAAQGIGDAITDARERGEHGADKAIALRDRFREVANLQGKTSPDDETVMGALNLRVRSGMSTDESDKFLRKFYGSIEAGKDKGNIDAPTAEKVAEIGGATGVRTGMSVGTAGDLAASLANYAPIKSETTAAGQLGTIVDQLNKGRGDLTPLTDSLLKTAGSTVGKGMPFQSLPELSAAIGVASNNASPSGAGTMVRQAQRGLFSFGKEQGDTLREHKIESGDSFVTAIDKIAPLVEKAQKAGKNPMAALESAGFGNMTDRQAISFFVQNRALLRTRLDQVQGSAGADGSFTEAGKATIAKNDEFMASPVAKDRIGRAQVDRAEYGRYASGTSLQTERKSAEARLIERGEIDTPETNITDFISDVGPIGPMLGYPSARKRRIDRETGRPGMDSAGPVGDTMSGFKTGTGDELAKAMNRLTTATEQANKQRAARGLPPSNIPFYRPDDIR